MTQCLDENIARLEELFARLPGLGPRSAARIVMDLLTHRKDLAQDLVSQLGETLKNVHHCPRCHALITQEVCAVCDDPQRDHSMLCVVESSADLKAIESSVAYRGDYFVLMGRVNPLMNTSPEELGMPLLMQRIQTQSLREVIIATSYTPEGETTAHFIAGAIKKHCPNLRVTRLARGLPSGVEIEYTDVATIACAVIERH